MDTAQNVETQGHQRPVGGKGGGGEGTQCIFVYLQCE